MGGTGKAERLAARTALPAAPEPALDRFADLTRRVIGVPVALVTLVDRDRQVFPGASGLAEPWLTRRETPLSYSFCQHVVVEAVPLVVSDAREEPRLASSPGVSEFGFIAYAGMPLLDTGGRVIGSLCVADHVVRQWTDSELADLEDLATACATELSMRQLTASVDRESLRMRQLVESMPVGYIAYDSGWRVTTVNEEAARIVESTVEALTGNVLWDLFPATVGSDFETIYRRVQDTGTPAVFEYFYPAPLDKWYEIRVQGGPTEVSAFFLDVTGRHESDTRAETILAAMPVGFVALDEDFRVTAANSLGAELVGTTVDDLVGHVAWDLFPGLEESTFGATYKRVASTGVPEVLEAFYPQPLNAWYEVRALGDQGRLSLFFVDVSERHRAQALLEQTAEHDRSVAQTLQAALLVPLPTVPGARLAARYLTAEGTEQVGGDWYDAVLQSSGALAVSIGDVCGHGIEAAAAMGQLRSMLRAFVWDDLGAVAECLSQLDRAAHGHAGLPFATLVTGRIDGLSGDAPARLVWSNAGHPPPLLLLADGTVERVEATPELMLGVDPETGRSDREHQLPPGSTLVLYTDGLVERRSESIEDGIARLVQALRRHYDRDLEEMLDRVLQDLRREHQEDDIAVLAIRVDDH